MPGCRGQTREHATHVRSTRSLVPARPSFDPSRRDDIASRTWQVFAQDWASLRRIARSDGVYLLALLVLRQFFR